MKAPILQYYPDERPYIPWQWWRDGDYLAGFATEAAAMEYARLMGWCR